MIDTEKSDRDLDIDATSDDESFRFEESADYNVLGNGNDLLKSNIKFGRVDSAGNTIFHRRL